MKFCGSCGASLRGAAKFCAECGEPVAPAADAVVAVVPGADAAVAVAPGADAVVAAGSGLPPLRAAPHTRNAAWIAGLVGLTLLASLASYLLLR
ncbi:MAG: hypothetical protein Q7V88_04085 [Actinomycetota bacterium]|nr:hypothetical protein [Actinomycetota bacterium]